MARKPTDSPHIGKGARLAQELEERLIADDQHPDYLDGALEGYDGEAEAGIPRPIPPLRICAPVSGLYRLKPMPPIAVPAPGPHPAPHPLLPLFRMAVRVDVDRYFPQQRISIELTRTFPQQRAHVIAEVTSDQCLGFNRRRIEGAITYRDGDAGLLPGDHVMFEAQRTTGKGYGSYRLVVDGGGMAPRSYALAFVSTAFDRVEFEVDCIDNAGTPTLSYDTASHPNRPADLPAETITLATAYRRAGFQATMSPNTTTIPLGDAGSNGTWSDAEMHNAMVTYWSRFQNLPQWAMWVLFAARHDMGRSLGGIMFDDIGPNHRQGTAIFTDSFIQDVPAGDPNPAAWAQRMVFWTMAHEVGHAFNLAHSWQKSLGTPWIPLLDEPEARSFMNYPYNVDGGEASFFSDFRFRFSDPELVFLRHAPRRFVQMGNSDWFVNHGFEEPTALQGERPARWKLQVRPNREANVYAFMEPVKLELKLTNVSAMPLSVEHDLLTEGAHVSLLVAREQALARPWQPFMTRCQQPREKIVQPGKSIYGQHLVSATTTGWLIDEPGFYQVQAAVEIEGEIVLSNVLRLQVATPASAEESKLALDYFSEDVGRTLAFDGAPQLIKANDTLKEVIQRVPASPAAIHATVAVTTPHLRTFKWIDAGKEPRSIVLRSEEASTGDINKQAMALTTKPDAAADTLGHIHYFCALDRLARAVARAGDEGSVRKVLNTSVNTMKKRGVLQSVIDATETKLERGAKALAREEEEEIAAE